MDGGMNEVLMVSRLIERVGNRKRWVSPSSKIKGRGNKPNPELTQVVSGEHDPISVFEP
jgi:hypothetical protein